MRVAMFEKQAMLTKNNTDFFNKFSLIFREKSMQNRCKIMSNDYSHKNQQKNTFGTWFLSEKSILNGFWGSLRVPGKAQKGRATLGKTAPWRDLVQFCSFASITFAAGSISTPFGHHFNTILTPFCLLSGTIFIPLWHKRDCLPAVQHDCDASAGLENCHASSLKYLLNAAYGNDDTLSVSGPAECAKRFEYY